jgi:hypothetical protein
MRAILRIGFARRATQTADQSIPRCESSPNPMALPQAPVDRSVDVFHVPVILDCFAERGFEADGFGNTSG